ncbi:MAG TPA: hypothetical protein VFM62_01060 [Arthrobacter sp.]|nr:hypothetical protein [Arthrobacter sp.]
MIANTLGEPVWWAALPRTAEGTDADGKRPFAVLAPDGESGISLWAIAVWPSKPPVLKFYRTGPWRGLSVFTRKGPLYSIEWGPVWTAVDPSRNRAGAQEQGQADQLVRQALERLEIVGVDENAIDMAASLLPRKRWWTGPATGNGERLNRVLGVLRNRLSPDPFSEIAAALGIPSSLVDIAEGRLHPKELPGAKHYEAEGLMRATWKSAALEADEPGFSNWLYLRWIDRPLDYWVYCMLFGPGLIAIAGVELNNHTSRWPAWLLRAAVVVGALTTADMLVPRKRRRLSSLT